MNIKKKIKSALMLSLTFTSMLSASVQGADTLFLTLAEAENTNILNAVSTNSVDPNVYVTCKASVDMKAEATNNSEQIRLLPMDYNLTVLGTENGWIYVEDDDNNKGYVYSSNVTFKNGEKPANKNLKEEKALEVVSFSQQYLGTPYVWGGTSLTSGVDCSGFVYCIYKNFGITLQRSSKGMYASNGVYVDRSQLKPGDLLFFNTNGNGVSHVGMYIGNNQYIHAADVNVKISDLNSSYSQRTYVGAKRILV